MEIYITKLNTISMMESLATWTGHYSAQSGKLSNIFFLTGYQTLIGQRTFFALGSSLEIYQGHVTTYVIIYGHQKLKFGNFQI